MIGNGFDISDQPARAPDLHYPVTPYILPNLDGQRRLSDIGWDFVHDLFIGVLPNHFGLTRRVQVSSVLP